MGSSPAKVRLSACPRCCSAALAEAAACRAERCAGARGAFRLLQWRALRGAARTWRAHNASAALDVLLLAPAAELELRLSFAPALAAPLTAYLYLRCGLFRFVCAACSYVTNTTVTFLRPLNSNYISTFFYLI